MVRLNDQRREHLVHSTLKAGWARFGARELDEATYDYVAGVACEVMAEAGNCKAGESELLEQLGPLLEAQNLDEKQVLALCRAIARGVFPATMVRNVTDEVSVKQKNGAILCHVENLILMYMGGSRLLLKDTTFELLRGHCYGVVGSNGAGKTTLMERIAAGAITELSKKPLRFAHVHHEILSERINPATSARDYLRSVACGVTKENDDQSVRDALDQVGFTEELEQKTIRELSGGWRMRLLLAAAVMHSADVLLLDETKVMFGFVLMLIATILLKAHKPP